MGASEASLFKPLKEALGESVNLSNSLIEKWSTDLPLLLALHLDETPEQVEQLLREPRVASNFLEDASNQKHLLVISWKSEAYCRAVLDSGIGEKDPDLQQALLASKSSHERMKSYSGPTV